MLSRTDAPKRRGALTPRAGHRLPLPLPSTWAALLPIAVAAALAVGASSLAALVPAPADAAAATRHPTHAANPPPTATRPGDDGVIGHHGRWLTDSQGRVVYLHGVNLVAKTDQSPAAMGFGAKDADWLVAHGFDAVRLGFTAAAMMPRPGVIDRPFLTSYLHTVHQLTSRGLLVLVDLHQDGWGPSLGSDGFPAWMTETGGAKNTHTGFPTYYLTNPAIQTAFQSFWDDAKGPGGVRLQARVAQIFSTLSAHLASDPGVLGYELINEPWPGTVWKSCLDGPDGCPRLDAGELARYDARMTAALRRHDRSHLVFAEPWVLFNFGEAPTNVPLPGGDRRSGLAFHQYTLSPALEPKVLDYALAWSARTGGALVDSEFGATSDPAAIDRQVDELDRDLIPWLWWSFDGLVVKNVAKPPTGANLDQPVVTALVRPHPVLVAGTPTALAYHEATSTLNFTYATTGPGGRHYAKGTPTVLDVPASVYPRGDRVVVTGGSVRPRHIAGQLEVVASPHAASVSITISPS